MTSITMQALHYALEQQGMPEGRVLWLYGEAGAVLAGDVYQPMKDQAEALEARGLRVFSDIAAIPESYDAVLGCLPKQQEEARGLTALALSKAKQLAMVAAANDAGGKRLGRLIESFGLQAGQVSKHKCRVVWAQESGKADAAKLASGLAQLEAREVEMGGESWHSLPGLFSWDQVDEGSALLLAHLPADLSGEIADFGCGYGALAVRLAELENVTVDAFDLDARALACVRLNAEERHVSARIHTHWQDMRRLNETARYDAVVMNPPFHQGKKEAVLLGQAFIEKALAALKPGGRLFFVANRQLPYEHLVPNAKSLYEDGVFKVIEARR